MATNSDRLTSTEAQLRRLEEKLAAAQTAREKVDALNALAWQWRDRLSQRGLEYAEHAYELAQAEHYELGIGHSLVNQSLFIINDSFRALKLASQALALFERLQDQAGQCRALSSLCAAYRLMDDFVQAIDIGQRGLALATALNDQDAQADVLINLGVAYKRAGNYELAYSVYQQARQIYQTMGNHIREGIALTDLAIAHAAHGEYDLALQYVRECEDLGVDEPNVRGHNLLVLGQIYSGKKEFERALQYLHQTLQFTSSYAEMELSAQHTLQAIGQVYIEQQELDQAIGYLQQGLSITHGVQSNLMVFQFHEMLSKIYETQGKFAEALWHYQQFHIVKEKIFNEDNTRRRLALEIQHQTEIARHNAEIYRLHSIELQQEINERQRLQEELRQLAITDELTQVFNRRHFLELARTELDRALRLQHPVALAVIDLDHLKQFNDTYGHAAGDQAIMRLANIYKNNIRSIDAFARFGGDEFALLLPETDRNMALNLLQRIQRVLAESPLDLGEKQLTLTMSVGIADLDNETASVDMLIARADQALYRAKEAGRNCVSL